MNQPNLDLTIQRWASLVILAVYSKGSLLGFILGIEPKKKTPCYKFIGGSGEDEDSAVDFPPLGTAYRETKEESGLDLPLDTFHEIKEAREWRTAPNEHWVFTFIARITESQILDINDNHPENGGVKPKYFTLEEIENLINNNKFLRRHLERLSIAKSKT